MIVEGSSGSNGWARVKLCVPGSFILARVTGQFIVRLKVFPNGNYLHFSNENYLLEWNSNPMFYANPLLQKTLSGLNYILKKYFNGWARVNHEQTKLREHLLRTILFDSDHLQHERERPDMERKYVNSSQGPVERARVNNLNQWSRWWHKYKKQGHVCWF